MSGSGEERESGFWDRRSDFSNPLPPPMSCRACFYSRLTGDKPLLTETTALPRQALWGSVLPQPSTCELLAISTKANQTSYQSPAFHGEESTTLLGVRAAQRLS